MTDHPDKRKHGWYPPVKGDTRRGDFDGDRGMRSIFEFTDSALIKELEGRGYRISLSKEKSISWSRTIEPDFNEEAFRWEAVHRIASMIEPKHLVFNITQGEGPRGNIISGKLYL